MREHFDGGFDPSDSANFITAPAQPPNAETMLGAPIIVPDEELAAEAAFAASGSGGTGSVVAVTGATSAGLTINLLFDAAAMAAPQSFRDGVTQAMQMICAAVTDHLTLNLQIDYSGTGGGAYGGPSGGNYVAYSTVRADLVNNASPGDATFNSLPTGSTIAGQSQVAVWYSQEKLWGLLSPTGTEVDGSASFATDISPSLLVGVALHELTHAMGRVPYGSQPDIFDFYRFTSPGINLFNGNSTAPAAYFSLDGGVTKLADYGRTSDPSDFLNSGVQGQTDPFNEFYSNSTQQQLTAIDLKQLDALGFHLVSNTPTIIEAVGATKLDQIGNNYFMDPVAGSAGTGPELKFGGSVVVAGQFSGWTLLGAEQTSGGYEVAWKNPTTGSFTVWNTDGTGNEVSGSSQTADSIVSFETSFHQDLNGDGVIGPPASAAATTIEAFGATKLDQIGSGFFMDAVGGSSGTGPELKFGGSVVVAGQFSGWILLGAEHTSSGYEVAWKNPTTGSFTVWNTDSQGNEVSGSSQTADSIVSFETSFHQDLNGDGVIGPAASAAATVIEAFGATKLDQIGSGFFMDAVGGNAGTGPELKFGGSVVVAGQFSGWTLLGAEQTSGGYEAAWKNSTTGSFTVWNTDSNGNEIAGSSQTATSIASFETSFHQDLNGDGVIGTAVSATATVIEAFGATKLDQVGNNYFMDPVAGSAGSGPELKFGASVVSAGQFGSSWTLLGAEQNSSEYEVAWKNTATGSFTVWKTDNNGNEVSGTSETATSIVSFETSFHQDLNGDGVIGAPATTASQTISISHQDSANFNFRPSVSSTFGSFIQLGGDSGLPSHPENPTPAGELQHLLESIQTEQAIAAPPGQALAGLFGDHLDHFLIR